MRECGLARGCYISQETEKNREQGGKERLVWFMALRPDSRLPALFFPPL